MVSKDGIKMFSEKHDLERLWLSACSIPGTQNTHSLEILSDSMAISFKTYATSDLHVTHHFAAASCNDTVKKSDSETVISEPAFPTLTSQNSGIQLSDIVPGSTYIAVIYDDVWWPGLVHGVNQETNKIAISFMCQKSRNRFMWPSKEQVAELPPCEILCVLEFILSLVNQRGLYTFPQDETDRVNKLMKTVLKK